MASAANIRVDHVGSLLRPAKLRESREQILGVHDADRNLEAHDNAELRAIEDGHVRDVVRMQEDCGLPVVTDGEFRRRSWWTDVFLSFTGTSITYAGKSPLTVINAKGETRPMPTVDVTAPVHWQGSVSTEPFKFLKSVTTRLPKVAIPAPAMIHFVRARDFVPSVYSDLDAFWDDLIATYRKEVKALADAGCRYLQFDECILSYLCDPRHQNTLRARGEDPMQLADVYCRLINDAITERPSDMIIGLHSCRGNMNSFWGAEGGYEPVAERLFNAIDADIYLLEYDTPRAGDFTPLRHVPKGKRVLLGLISTKDPALEDPDMLMRRIEEAGKSIDHDQLGICPQCGFSTNLFGSGFTEDDERRKLALMVEVAARAWAQ